MSEESPAFDVVVAVDCGGAGWLVSIPEQSRQFFDGSSIEDNNIKPVPEEPGLYLLSVRFVFHQGYFEGYWSAGESDWEFRVESTKKLVELPVLNCKGLDPVPDDEVDSAKNMTTILEAVAHGFEGVH